MINEEKERRIREAIFRNIYNEVDKHGSFLTTFAHAFVLADLDNQRLLTDAAKNLITKYDLETRQVERGILKVEQYDIAT